MESLARIKMYPEEIKKELLLAASCPDIPKDILIVVHDQLNYMIDCVNSLRENTENYNLYVWDNASGEETRKWLCDMADERIFKVLIRSKENLGFILPNNELARYTKSPYLLFLNSDTTVLKDWDKGIISHLLSGYSQVGYGGGFVNKECTGFARGFGDRIDYIEGWAFGLSREVYKSIGLFDSENLTFAYGEDFDLSMRLKEQGHRIYALHLNLVNHAGS